MLEVHVKAISFTNATLSKQDSDPLLKFIRSHPPLMSILLRGDEIILANLTRIIPKLLELLVPVRRHSPDTLPQPLMPLPILLYPLLDLPLVDLLRAGWRVCFSRGVTILGLGRELFM